MGLFDDVTCEYPLPDGVSVPRGGFQTKSMDDPYLDDYKITAEGELWLLHYELVPSGLPESEFRPFKRVNEEWQRVDDFRGEIRFYGDIDGKWHEYSALFDGGRLLSILALPDRHANSHSEAKA